MRLLNSGRSDNVEDRRRIRPGGIAVGGGIGAAIFSVLALLWGAEQQPLVGPAPKTSEPAAKPAGPAANPDLKDFVSAILGDTETVWTEVFARRNQVYKKPRVVLFTDSVKTACGAARSELGPFYCAADQKIYIDLGFFQVLEDRYLAPGDFARAYVIAHEVGHHVQNLMGISAQVRARQQGSSATAARELSVRLELQADFLAGAWAHHAQKARQILEPGDVEAGLRAATALGDDRPELDSRGDRAPGSFTRCWVGRSGTSKERVRWFKRGLETGDLSQGDTLKADEL